MVAVSGGPDSVALLDMLMRLSSGVRDWGSGVREEQRGGGAEERGSDALICHLLISQNTPLTTIPATEARVSQRMNPAYPNPDTLPRAERQAANLILGASYFDEHRAAAK